MMMMMQKHPLSHSMLPLKHQQKLRRRRRIKFPLAAFGLIPLLLLLLPPLSPKHQPKLKGARSGLVVLKILSHNISHNRPRLQSGGTSRSDPGSKSIGRKTSATIPAPLKNVMLQVQTVYAMSDTTTETANARTWPAKNYGGTKKIIPLLLLNRLLM